MEFQCWGMWMSAADWSEVIAYLPTGYIVSCLVVVFACINGENTRTALNMERVTDLPKEDDHKTKCSDCNESLHCLLRQDCNTEPDA